MSQIPRAAALRAAINYYHLLQVWCIEDGKVEQAKAYADEAERLRGLLTLGIVPPELAA